MVGNLAQRMCAVELLAYAKDDFRDEAGALCVFLADRARRRGEWALVEKVNRVLGSWAVIKGASDE